MRQTKTAPNATPSASILAADADTGNLEDDGIAAMGIHEKTNEGGTKYREREQVEAKV